MTLIPPIILATLGCGINAQYFNLYFLDAGYPVGLSTVMAISFIGFESFLWFRSDQYKWLKVSMVIFSILVTLSSQFSSTSARETEAVTVINQAAGHAEDVARYERELEEINAAMAAINQARTEDFMFTRTDADLNYYRAEKARYEDLLTEARAANWEAVSESVSVRTIYDWFAVDLPEILRDGIAPDLIRVLFQLFSSFVLALMAPVCLTLVRNRPIVRHVDPEQPTPEPEPKRDWSQEVKRWVNMNWIGIRTGKSDGLLSENSFYQACGNRGVLFSREDYAAIKKAAEKQKIVDKNVITCKDEIDAVKALLSGL